MWHDDDSDLEFAQYTPISGQFAKRWESEPEQQAAGDLVPFYELMARKSAQRWRGPAVVRDIGGMGATVIFQGQISRAAGNCVRKRMGPMNWGDVDWIPASERWHELEVWPSSVPGKCV